MKTEMHLNPLNMMKGIICGMVFLFVMSAGVRAQDTTKRKTINITSTFKPALKNTAKLNFNADAPLIDTARTVLQYNMPVQFLSLMYQPAGLNPVAISADPVKNWNNDNYIKVGAGNVDLPYVQAGLRFGDRQHAM